LDHRYRTQKKKRPLNQQEPALLRVEVLKSQCPEEKLLGPSGVLWVGVD